MIALTKKPVVHADSRGTPVNLAAPGAAARGDPQKVPIGTFGPPPRGKPGHSGRLGSVRGHPTGDHAGNAFGEIQTGGTDTAPPSRTKRSRRVTRKAPLPTSAVVRPVRKVVRGEPQKRDMDAGDSKDWTSKALISSSAAVEKESQRSQLEMSQVAVSVRRNILEEEEEGEDIAPIPQTEDSPGKTEKHITGRELESAVSNTRGRTDTMGSEEVVAFPDHDPKMVTLRNKNSFSSE